MGTVGACVHCVGPWPSCSDLSLLDCVQTNLSVRRDAPNGREQEPQGPGAADRPAGTPPQKATRASRDLTAAAKFAGLGVGVEWAATGGSTEGDVRYAGP